MLLKVAQYNDKIKLGGHKSILKILSLAPKPYLWNKIKRLMSNPKTSILCFNIAIVTWWTHRERREQVKFC